MFAKVTKVLASVLVVAMLFANSVAPVFASGTESPLVPRQNQVPDQQTEKIGQGGEPKSLGAVRVTKTIIKGTAQAIRYGAKWIGWLVKEYGDDEIAYVISTKSNTIANFLDSISVMEEAAIQAIKMRLPGVLVKAGVEKGLAQSVSLVVADIVRAATWIL